MRITPGTYVLDTPLTITQESKKSDYRITFKGTDTENPPLIDGGAKITGWVSMGDGRYRAEYTGQNVRQLYVNGTMRRRARSKYLYTADSYYYATAEAKTAGTPDGLTVENINFPQLSKPGDVELVYNLFWASQRLPVDDIIGYDTDTLTLEMAQPYYGWALSKSYEGTSPNLTKEFYLENALEFLDEPGEFYHDADAGFLYYYPLADEDMTNADCHVNKTDFMVLAKGTKENPLKNITFENLDFRYGGWSDVNDTGVLVHQSDCLEVEDTSGNKQRVFMPAQMQIENATGIEIKSCKFINLGSSAISMTGVVTNSTIDGNLIRDIAGTGISAGGFFLYTDGTETAEDTTRNCTITNNAIVRTGQEFFSSPAIGVYYSNNMNISNNYIEDVPYSGISLGWGWGVNAVPCENHTVSGNRIVNIGHTLHDGGHIYTLGNMPNTVIENNYISQSDNYGGIYFDSGSGGITACNNVAESCTNWLFGLETTSKNIIVQNNYADTPEKYTILNQPESTCTIDTAIAIADAQSAANAIKEAAGVGDAYKSMLDEIPGFSLGFLIPTAQYFTDDNFIVPADKYTSFQMNSDGNRPDKPIVGNLGGYTYIQDGRVGEWTEYTVDLEEPKNMNIFLRYAYYNSANPEATCTATVTVNGEAKEYVLSSTGGWQKVEEFDLGVYSLKDGDTVRVEFTENVFSFNGLAFKLDGLTTDAAYDDGKYSMLQQ